MILSSSLIQKAILTVATAGLLSTGTIIINNTRELVATDARLTSVERITAKMDTLNDRLSTTNANIAALNAHIEDIRHEQDRRQSH